jgi:hypothetical protein
MLLLICVGIAGSRQEMTPAGTFHTFDARRTWRQAFLPSRTKLFARLYQFSTSGEVKKNTQA